jgi:ribosomal protein L5
MNITFVTTAKSNDETRRMLALFGMPFRTQKSGDKADQSEMD